MTDYPQSLPLKSKNPPLRNVFFHSLVREFATTGFLVFIVLLSIVLLTQLIRLLGESVSGSLVVEGVLVMLGFSALNSLPVLLSVSMFLSVLLTLTRCYRDSEMVVWFASGVSLTRWLRPVLWYAAPVVGLIALLSLGLTPWALSKADEYKRRLESRDDVSNAAPGMFRESKQADRVYFLEKVNTDEKRVSNIFVQSVQHGRAGTMVAKEGYQETAANGDRFLVMLNGLRYEGIPGQADYRITEFERYAMRIEPAELRQEAPSLRTLTTLELLREPTTWKMAELEWRISMPLSALFLTLLAIPLSYVNPRAGRSLNLIVAMVLYLFYNNMISIANTWVGQGKISATAGLLGIHMLMLAAMLLFFYHRSQVSPWRRWRR